jgi:hypothetical protein
MDTPKIARNDKGQFLKGTEGLGGRPKGCRNKLGEAFIRDLYEDWSENGIQALKDCREQNPAAYVRTVASLLPKDVNLNVNVTEQLTDDELASGLLAVRQALAVRERASKASGEEVAH